jgi:hypothetical protein
LAYGKEFRQGADMDPNDAEFGPIVEAIAQLRKDLDRLSIRLETQIINLQSRVNTLERRFELKDSPEDPGTSSDVEERLDSIETIVDRIAQKLDA